MEFIITNNNGDVGSKVDEAKFKEIFKDYVSANISTIIAARGRLSSSKLTKDEVLEILDTGLSKTLDTIERIAKVRVKP